VHRQHQFRVFGEPSADICRASDSRRLLFVAVVVQYDSDNDRRFVIIIIIIIIIVPIIIPKPSVKKLYNTIGILQQMSVRLLYIIIYLRSFK